MKKNISTKYIRSTLFQVPDNTLFKVSNEDNCDCIYKKISFEKDTAYYRTFSVCQDCKRYEDYLLGVATGTLVNYNVVAFYEKEC